MIDCKLRWIDSTQDAWEFITWLGERRPIMGLDTETEGLKLYAGDGLRLVQFGDPALGWAISANRWRGVIEEALNKYEGPVCLSNAKFDAHALEQAGLTFPKWSQVHDTVVMSRLLDPDKPAGLKSAGERYFPGSGVGETVLNEAKRKGGWTWASIPEDNLAYVAYSAWDPALTSRMAEVMWPRINAEGYREAYDREMVVQAVLYRAERRGMRIDPQYTSMLKSQWDDEMAVLLMELNEMGLSNPNSGRQVAAAMQIAEKWEPDELTETGQPKMDETVLRGIDSEISRRVLRHRRLKKWTANYLNKFLTRRDLNDRIHPSINTMQARTGRMSITGDAALQTLPRGSAIRDCFLPDDGHALWSVDYNTMEARVFASYANETGMLEAIRSGVDLHTFAAQQVYGDPSITKKDPRRQLAKNTGFGLIYGAGYKTIAATAGVAESAAKDFLAMYLDRFPGVDAFMKAMDSIGRRRLAEEGGAYVKTWGGRLAPADPDRIYALVNYLIQGSCADLFKAKIVALDQAGYGDAIVVPVHDELIFNFPIGDTDSPKEATSIMEEHSAFATPLTCEAVGPLTRWGDKGREEQE